VYVCDGGVLGTLFLPEIFTDRTDPPATGPLTVDVLTDLASVVSALHKGVTGGREESTSTCI
jgi:hypothetical protein